MDCFAELGIKRGLVLDPEELRSRYDARCREVHPDAGGDPEAFQRLRASYEILASPGRRLRHWLGEAAEDRAGRGAVPGAVADLFGELGDTLRRADEAIAARGSARSALARSMAEAQGLPLLDDLERARMRITEMMTGLLARFPEFEERGPERASEDAGEVARGLAFLEKWEGQLRERWAGLAAS